MTSTALEYGIGLASKGLAGICRGKQELDQRAHNEVIEVVADKCSF
jgi:hypothetical protein